jgi:hypothetical protein
MYGDLFLAFKMKPILNTKQNKFKTRSQHAMYIDQLQNNKKIPKKHKTWFFTNLR